MKTCIKCKESKPEALFVRARNICKKCQAEYHSLKYQERRAYHLEYSKARYWANKEEILAVQNKRRRDNPTLRKMIRINRLFGLTEDEYNRLIANGCEVCGSFEKLCIDHDHSCCPDEKTCGKCVRGVLCANHNTAMGLTHDSIDELLSMAAYLMQFENVLREKSYDIN